MTRPMDLTAALRSQLERQVSHWQVASVALEDPTSFASPQAWQSLERYLDRAVRTSLGRSTDRLRREVAGLRTQLDSARTIDQLMSVARRLQRVRRSYSQVETVISFYAEAVNTRTSPVLGVHMRALDHLAVASMATVLSPLGRPIPPVLTYVDKGLGAAILRAGVRLWDGQLSPAAAIKVTRHNLYRPSSLVHETGHQVAHIIGWTAEASTQLGKTLAKDAQLAVMWRSWTSEMVADAYAFAHCGYAAVAALHDVVANELESVMHLTPGDPHPISYLRVLLGVAMCRVSFGAGPWDELEAAWIATNPIAGAQPGVRELITRSVSRVASIADVLLTGRFSAFGARSLVDLVDVKTVAPRALETLATQSGPSLFTSSHLVRREGLRIVALTGLRIATDPVKTPQHVADFARFAQTLGSPDPIARPLVA
jgi:hypothetical protein